MNIKKVVGENLRFYRKEIGWTQEKLSVRAKVDVYYISRLERGQVNVSAETMVKFAKKLKIEPYLLMKPRDTSESL